MVPNPTQRTSSKFIFGNKFKEFQSLAICSQRQILWRTFIAKLHESSFLILVGLRIASPTLIRLPSGRGRRRYQQKTVELCKQVINWLLKHLISNHLSRFCRIFTEQFLNFRPSRNRCNLSCPYVLKYCYKK